jgi:DNA-binding PadR family transcriptional regulator
VPVVDFKGHVDLLLLGLLEAGPAHGYQMVETLRERSEGVFDLPEGTIYPALYRLERAGAIDSRWETVSGRRRRMYFLTRRGRAELAKQQEAWKTFVRGMEAVLA